MRASEEDGFISGEKSHDSERSFKTKYSPWLMYSLLAVAWAVSLALTFYISGKRSHRCEGLSEVFPTELLSVQPAIELEKVRFSGTLDFDENSTLISTYWDPDSPKYTGEPSEDLDQLWNALIYRKGYLILLHPILLYPPMYLVDFTFEFFANPIAADGVDLQGEEAKSIQGKTFEKPGGWSIVSIDVFHQLHCLNLLRQGLYPDYYTKHDPEPEYTIHRNHCLDHIRQALMCHVDVTPIPVIWAEKEGRPYNDFQVEHTCRNFGKVKEWAKARSAKGHEYMHHHHHQST
ncbi:hypothetical protein N7478_004574 [Penicillium angulare]|uniref:uncharacterized protein n=1 Tax=Penicillium angulare TaxID=116970 RepID=UPI00254059FC|nr:uncharacterized protein N7478_004574 [Penicillium angulare]KAJ5279202.1 hypothetical protein N7478_004574 [Penicillium angulare]